MTGGQPNEALYSLAENQRQVLDLKRALENAMATRDAHAANLSNRGYSFGALASAMGLTRSAVQAMISRVIKDKVL